MLIRPAVFAASSATLAAFVWRRSPSAAWRSPAQTWRAKATTSWRRAAATAHPLEVVHPLQFAPQLLALFPFQPLAARVVRLHAGKKFEQLLFARDGKEAAKEGDLNEILEPLLRQFLMPLWSALRFL